ncbi:hypothetical protein [Candidatus Poriferisocius sp.]|uniref:hypothetical protein n=1 Tax=Candidatus Poriferisocius sp. TaxID=3101276 RepID=UPI003B0249D4
MTLPVQSLLRFLPKPNSRAHPSSDTHPHPGRFKLETDPILKHLHLAVTPQLRATHPQHPQGDGYHEKKKQEECCWGTGVEVHIEKIDARFEGLDARMEKMDTRIEGVKTHVVELGDKVDRLGGRVTRIEGKLDIPEPVTP